MKYIATFYSHFDAVSFRRHAHEHGVAATLSPVPRRLSSSCGTCARFEADSTTLPELYTLDMEAMYEEQSDGYNKIHSGEA